MRLDGVTGRMQGQGSIVYHIDVKATDKPQSADFRLTQDDLNKVRTTFRAESPHIFQ